MKIATAQAQFPDLKGDCYVVTRGSASSAALAAGRAMRLLFRDPKVRGKRIHSVHVTVTIRTEEEKPAI